MLNRPVILAARTLLAAAVVAAVAALALAAAAPLRASAAEILYPVARLRAAGRPSRVAIDGDTLVFVSLDSRSAGGLARVYRHGADGWQPEAVLRSLGQPTDGAFGASVAISGATVAVGAPPYSVYVFVRQPAGGWVEQQQIAAPQSEAAPDFGVSLALSGDGLLVGGPTVAFSQNVGGSAFAYRRAAGRWHRDAVFFDAADDSYGFTVGLAGNLAAIGNTFGNPIDVLRRGPGGWVHLPAVPAGDKGGAFFSLSGDTLAVGGEGQPLAIWQLRGDAWTRQATLSIESTVLSLDGDVLAAAIPGDGVEIYRRQGRAGAWVLGATLEEPRADPVAGFGAAVALSDGFAVVSSNGPVWVFAPGDD